MDRKLDYKCPTCGEAFIRETEDRFKIKEKGFHLLKNGQIKIKCLSCKKMFVVDEVTSNFLKTQILAVK